GGRGAGGGPVHHVRGVLEAVLGHQVERARRELPGRRAPAHGPLAGQRRERLEAPAENYFLLLRIEIGDALVLVTVAADLVSRRRDGAHGGRGGRRRPRGDEEGRAHLGLVEQ